ncbi:MAG: 4-hydroxybenzoate octaprenyltransferase [Burkholderiales bacterium]|nr:4-hydroxybenzoate octaprenyltransferase [Burkholderiales bacterium]
MCRAGWGFSGRTALERPPCPTQSARAAPAGRTSTVSNCIAAAEGSICLGRREGAVATGRPSVNQAVTSISSARAIQIIRAVQNSRLPGRLPHYLDLVRWDRPAGWLLLLWPTLSALWIAADGWPGWKLFIVFVAGTVLMRSAGCSFNDVADREFDRHVKRTARRPVTSGAVSVREALTLGAVLALCAFAFVLTTSPAAIMLSVVALAVTLVYPFSKRFVSMPQAVLGVAFSFGIPMAFAAAQGSSEWRMAAIPEAVPPHAWWLLVSNLFWVLAYDTEYAMVDRDDDLRIGMKTSAITLGRFDVAAVMAFYGVHLASWAGLGRALGLGGWFLAGIGAASVQALWHYTLIRERTREGCFKAFRQNHWLGFAVFAGVAVDLALR